jgi:hypothetical protein
MLIVNRNQQAQFKFIFTSNGQLYDPTSLSTPLDIYFTVIRSSYGTGPIIDGPFSFLSQNFPESGSISAVKANNYEFTFTYTIPMDLYEGTYAVIAQTSNVYGNLSLSSNFQIKSTVSTLDTKISSPNKSVVVNYRPTYQQLDQSNTGTLLLIGHANGIGLNNPIKISTVQEAVDLLQADLNSPLLRGVFEAYSSGARDIIICASAPMSEYISNVSDRLVSTEIFDLASATPSSYTFYERYHERLATTYSIIKDLDFVDMIVPINASFIKTGNVDFLTQLANYLSDFHNSTGYVQLGVIGAVSNGVSSSDIDLIEQNNLFTDKFTQVDEDGNITSDIGRFIIPIYGEAVFQHPQLTTAYVAPAAAAFAGKFTNTSLNMGLIRTRVPGMSSVFGSDLTNADINRLETLGVNAIYRGKKTRRAVPFEVYVTNEYTMAHPNSTLYKAAQMRLVASVVSEVRAYGNAAIGKFGYDRAISSVSSYLNSLKKDKIIVDFSFNVEASPVEVGVLYFYIELLSTLGLRRINFTIAAGPEV